jgi:hypothetical protein
MELEKLEIDALIDTFIQIELLNPEDFLKIKETLTRMGVSDSRVKKLYQTCHVLFKRGKYYIVHFKELYGLDRNPTTMNEADYDRRDSIASTLEKWDLCKIVKNKPAPKVNPLTGESISIPFTIIPFKEKKEWSLEPKYTMGVDKKYNGSVK